MVFKCMNEHTRSVCMCCGRGRKVFSKGKEKVGELLKGRGCRVKAAVSASGSRSKMAEEFFRPLRIDICARTSFCHFTVAVRVKTLLPVLDHRLTQGKILV